MTQYMIIDLDNCIANDAWRIPRINWQKSNPMERYHDYHSLSGFDKPDNLQIFDDFPEAVGIIFTARPVLYRAVTEEWLKRHRVPFEYIVMRNNADHQPSLGLKRTMLEWLPKMYDISLDNIVAAYDDRPDVVEMYKSQGLNGIRRQIHNVCAYTNPNIKEPA